MTKKQLTLFVMRIFIRLARESVIIAVQELVNNKLRTFLSLLGITIGIFCVISVFTAVDSLAINIRDSFNKLGEDIYYVEKFSWGENPRMSWWKYMRRPSPTHSESVKLKERLSDVEAVTIMFTIPNRLAKAGKESMDDAVLNAVTYDYHLIKDLNFKSGRYFSFAEMQMGSNGAIIGDEVAKTLFPGQDPLGKTIKVLGTQVEVIGVLELEGEDIIGLSADDNIILCYNFVKNYLDMENSVFGARIAIKPKPNVSRELVKDDIRVQMRAIRKLNPVQEDDFSINELSLFSNILATVFRQINLAGLLIGIFSVLVGGFGVANIMFVSVKERTPMIGIKKSLGAKNLYILIEFLVEAIILCTIGGAVGLVLVYVGSVIAEWYVRNYQEMDFSFVLTWGNVGIGIGIAVLVGLVFGFIPAWSASRMKPVDAIRAN